MLDLHMQVEASLRPIDLLTGHVWAYMVSGDLQCRPSVMLLPPIRLLFIELFIIFIVICFEFDDLFQDLIPFLTVL
jgi:hypothetical protein